MTITQLANGQKGKIVSINGDVRLKKRLMALGAIEGTDICVTKRAPLGDPLVVNIRGFNIAIRKKDANNISVTTEES